MILRNLIIPRVFTDNDRITEFSFNAKNNQFVVRFINSETYVLNIKKLPKNILTKNPDFSNCFLNPKQNIIVFQAGTDIIRGISSIVVKTLGKEVE